MVPRALSAEELLLILGICLFAVYFFADYLFSVLYRSGSRSESKRIYLADMIIVQKPSLAVLESSGPPAQIIETSHPLSPSTKMISSGHKVNGGILKRSMFVELPATFSGSSGKSDSSGKRSSRHGFFSDDDDILTNGISDVEQMRNQPKLINSGKSVTTFGMSDDGEITEIISPSPFNKTSPTSSNGEGHLFHFRYNQENQIETPFSPLYNLPNISPYPTPFIRKDGREEFVPNSSLSEDAVESSSPSHSFRLQSPFPYDNTEEFENGGMNSAQSSSSKWRLNTSDIEINSATRSEKFETPSTDTRMETGSIHNTAMELLTTRFHEINSKEKQQSEKITLAVFKMVKINSVEAEKRNLLIQEYEIHDRRVRDEAKNETLRLNELKRLQLVEELELKNRAEEKLKQDRIEDDIRAAAALAAKNPTVPIRTIPSEVRVNSDSDVPKESRTIPTVNTDTATDVREDESALPYVRDARVLHTWLVASENKVRDAALSSDIAISLSEVEKQLQAFCTTTTSSTTSSTATTSEVFAMDEDTQNLPGNLTGIGSGNINVKAVLAVTVTAQKLLRVAASLGGDAFLCVLCRLCRTVLNCVSTGMKPTNVTLIANVLVGMFLVLPKDSDPLKESSLQNQGSQIFKAMLCGESELCIPHVGNNTVDRSRQKQRIALVELFGALIGTQSSDSPIPIDHGWTWLIRFSKQLEIAVKNGQNSTVQECCISLLLFLRQSSAALITRFGWKNIRKVLESVRTVVSRTSELSSEIPNKVEKKVENKVANKAEKKVESSDAEEMLIKWLDSAIGSEGVQCTLLMRHFEPHVMAAYRIISSVEDARLESESVDRDKGGLIMSTVKQLRIHTVPGIFNRLSASNASQILVVNQLFEKIVAASKENVPGLLRYTLCKIAAQLVSQSQSEFFIIEDESQSLPIARVAVGICQMKPELADVIKAEYYRICPLTVPRQAEGGLSGDDVFENMGFLRSKVSDDWEDSDTWLVRMNKVLCTFAVTVIQPEGVPYNLADGWAWVSNMVNACSRIANPSSYTADALDIFLRIVTPTMLSAYGNRFMDLLIITEKDILPKLKESSSKTRLKEFLEILRKSNGTNILPFFKKI